MQLVVTFFRNLLAVPDARATDGARGDHRTRLRGELLQRFVDDHVLELLLVFAQHTDEVRPRTASLLLNKVTSRCWSLRSTPMRWGPRLPFLVLKANNALKLLGAAAGVCAAHGRGGAQHVSLFCFWNRSS